MSRVIFFSELFIEQTDTKVLKWNYYSVKE